MDGFSTTAVVEQPLFHFFVFCRARLLEIDHHSHCQSAWMRCSNSAASGTELAITSCGEVTRKKENDYGD